MLLGRSRATRRHGRSVELLQLQERARGQRGHLGSAGSNGSHVREDPATRSVPGRVSHTRTLRHLKPQFPKLYNFFRARGAAGVPGKPWPEADGEVVVADAARLVQHVLRLCEASIEVRFEFRASLNRPQTIREPLRRWVSHGIRPFPHGRILAPKQAIETAGSQPRSTGVDVLLTSHRAHGCACAPADVHMNR